MLKVAIIGCGDMGLKHATAWSARENAEVVVVSDPDQERAASLAATFGASVTPDWREAIQEQALDVVSICTPARFHPEIAIQSARLGLHILCEKPMALTVGEADDMIKAADENSVQLNVCHQYRALSRYRIIQRLVSQGELGHPVHMRFMEAREVRPKLAMHDKTLSGGPVHDMAGHLFDLARYISGSEVVSVSAIGGVFGRGKERLTDVATLGVDATDIQLRFENGHCASIAINWGLPEDTPSYSHEVVQGPKALLYTQNPQLPDRTLGDLSAETKIVMKNGNGTRVIDCDDDDDGPEACIADLVKSIETARPGEFCAASARETLRLIVATLQSVESHQTVEL